VEFGVLGSLQVLRDAGPEGGGEAVDVGGAQPRTLLAMLLASAGRVVPVDSLIEAIWGDRPSASAGSLLQSYVSRLRRELEPHRLPGAQARLLRWEPPGYRLDVDPDEVDYLRFERLAGEGRDLLEAGSPGPAREKLRAALDLWRGPALVEFPDHEFAIGLATRLEERRLAAIEDRIAAELALGRHAAVVGELSELVREFGLREQLWGHLAVALYRSGRQAEALRSLDEMRRLLRDELGVDPSPPLRALQTRILDHDPALDPPAPESRPPAVPVPAHPAATTSGLVGRDVELGQLARALDDVLFSRSRLAIIEGEPGIGKTRLLEALADLATARGADARWGRSHEGTGAPAFWPWIEVLRPLTARSDVVAPAPDGHLERLLAPSGAVSLPEQGDRFAMFDEVAAMLERSSSKAPLLVILDDIQWADVASLELLEFLAGRLDDVPVFVAVSVRELEIGRNDALVSALAALSRRPTTSRLHLRGLDVTDAAVLVHRATGVETSAPVVAAIHDRADGNPFFITELARLVVAGDPSREDVLLRRTGVPAGVRDVVRRRLAALPERTMAVLEAAAVLGRDAELGALAHAARLERIDTLDALEPAVAVRLLQMVPDAPSTFRFAHALVREVVLDEVGPLQRARLHLRAADAIDATAGLTDDTAEVIANHLWAASSLADRGTVAAAQARAADVASRRFAYETAEELFDRAVQLSRATGDDPAGFEAELSALSRLLGLRRMLYGYSHSRELVPFDRVRELAHRTGRIDVLNELLWAEWAGAATACEFDVAEPLARQLLELGLQSEDLSLRASSYGAWGIQCWHLGRIREACQYLDRAMETEAMTGLSFASRGVHIENRILSAGFHIAMHELAGDIDDGEARVGALLADEPDRYGRTLLWTVAAWCGAIHGDPARAARAGRRAMEMDPDWAFPFYSVAAAMFRAWGLAELGDTEEALDLFAECMPMYEATHVRTIVPLHRSHHAVALSRAGRHDEAVARIDAAWDMLDTTGELWQVPALHLHGADVRHHAGAPPAEVREQLRLAVTTAEEQGSLRFARRAEGLARQFGIEASLQG
jgi:DNA-binding SARP family transcriptional activator